MLYNELRAFHAVASLGSFTAAADALAVTQPTMSNQVKALEERYGVVLLERRWRKVEPTDLGGQLLDLCRRILALQDEAEEL
ncbi:LysR family transcriptional regulator, partial [Pseudomonas aeruginosa]